MTDRSPWIPRTLASVIDVDHLGEDWVYVVVDEIIDGSVGLIVSPWPWLDDAGRLRFEDADEDEVVGVSLESFQELVWARRVLMVMTREDQSLGPDAARALSERAVRIGDVFAVPRPEGDAWIREGEPGRHDLLVREGVPIFDITYEAREEAKLAAAAAVAPPLDEEEARRFLGEDDDTGAQPEGDGPGGGGSGPPTPPKPAGIAPGGELVDAERIADLSPYA